MTIKNHRNLLNAILGFVLFVACIYVLVSKGLQVKYLIGSALSVGLIVVNLIWGQRENGAEEMIKGQADERDLYNAMKSSRAVIKITNDICFISAIILFVIYAITKTDIYLNIGATLVGVIIVMFIAFLLFDHYYENHN
jgi:Ca2+/Na+ antiporter